MLARCVQIIAFEVLIGSITIALGAEEMEDERMRRIEQEAQRVVFSCGTGRGRSVCGDGNGRTSITVVTKKHLP